MAISLRYFLFYFFSLVLTDLGAKLDQYDERELILCKSLLSLVHAVDRTYCFATSYSQCFSLIPHYVKEKLNTVVHFCFDWQSDSSFFF